MPEGCANDNAMPRTMPELDERMRRQFGSLVAAATLAEATHVMMPLRIAQSVAGQLRLEIGGLING